MQSNYYFAIVSIVLIVGMVLINKQLSFSEEDIAGQAVAKKISSKATAVAKTTSSKTTAKEFCGDKTCVDGNHVSCYENKKGECECEKCSSSKSWKVQKQFKNLEKSLKAKKTAPFSFSQIDVNNFISSCRSEKRYETGAPIIDAFMMEFLGEISEETLEDFAELLEIAYCDATDGEIVIKITPVKYTPSKSSQFRSNSMLEYQPYKNDSEWDTTFEELEVEYGSDWVQETRDLKYEDFLLEEDIDNFYYEWLYERSIYAETFDYNSGFQAYARQMGYNTEDYDLLIVLTGVYNEEYSSYYTSKYNLIYLEEKAVTLCPDCDGYYYSNDRFENDQTYKVIESAIHEIGHFTGAEHACETSYPDGCDTCSWANDVMSYCADRPISGETYYNIFLSCSMNFFEDYYLPNFPDGSSGNSYDDYYSCE
jgi:hypothetical protein